MQLRLEHRDMYHARNQARGLARAFRHRPTPYEEKVWRWLRGRRFMHLKFRRQYPIGRFILDFYCGALKLAIELDGSGHNFGADEERSAELARDGIFVLRIPNASIDGDETAVADLIASIIRQLEERSTRLRICMP